MKSERQNAILEIISTREIETQQQLLQALAERGICSTQATLSRDIKDMHLVKELGVSGNYRYAAAKQESDDFDQRLRKIFKEGVISCDVAQNLLIIKTIPGLAPAACSAIETMKVEGLVGTLAGHDTGFLALKDTAAAEHLYSEIKQLF